LPVSYWVNDSTRPISASTPVRTELGLPEDGFVFCCFNHNWKITEPIFDCWMRLLQNTAGSVLWLLRGSDLGAERLKQEAERRGVDPARLVFAPRMDNPDHLARHRRADLFLDTIPCNAHTTGADALWAGLPFITCAGDTLAGRVGMSLLQAMGL